MVIWTEGVVILYAHMMIPTKKGKNFEGMCATMEGYKYKSNNNLVQEIYPKLTKRSYKKYSLKV